jgi:hypothetical protein
MEFIANSVSRLGMKKRSMNDDELLRLDGYSAPKAQKKRHLQAPQTGPEKRGAILQEFSGREAALVASISLENNKYRIFTMYLASFS